MEEPITEAHEAPEAQEQEQSDGMEIILRKEWNAMPPTDSKPLIIAASYLLFGNTKSYTERLRRNVHNFESVATDSNREKVRAIQDFDSRHFGDIRYSFLIGGDGKVYEGRGWQRTPHLPKKYHRLEDKCLFITMLEPIPAKGGEKEMLNTRHRLIKEGITRGYIKANCLEITMNNKLFWPPFRKFLSRI